MTGSFLASGIFLSPDYQNPRHVLFLAQVVHFELDSTGVTSIGFLDLSNVLIPKINIKANNGVTITNLSEDGLKMKKQYLPQVDLGN